MHPALRALIISSLFFVVLGIFILTKTLPWLLAAWYLLLSLITLAMYAWDKSAAKRNRQRTPEITLHQLALLGGWPGALIAQQWLRHKSQKRAFRLRFWLTVVVNNLALAAWLGFSLTK